MHESLIVLVQTGYSLGVVGGGVMLPPTTAGLAADPSGAAGLGGTDGSAGTMPLAEGGTAPVGTFAFGSAEGGVVGAGAVVSVGGVVGDGAVVSVGGCGAGGTDSGGVVVDGGDAASGGVGCIPCAHAGKAAPASNRAGSINRVFIVFFLPQGPYSRNVSTPGGAICSTSETKGGVAGPK